MADDDDYPTVELSDEGENWMSSLRLERLRALGWTGTVSEYASLYTELDGDPLSQTPPITGPR